jgi:hypothetical protein
MLLVRCWVTADLAAGIVHIYASDRLDTGDIFSFVLSEQRDSPFLNNSSFIAGV